MKIRTKILFGFVLIAIIGLSLGIAGLISVRTIADMTNELRAMQTTSGNVVNVLNAHYVWRGGLTEAVLKGDPESFTGSLDPTACAFGTWAASEEAQRITDHEVLGLLQQVQEPHNYIHTEAARVIEMMGSGQAQEAQTLMLDEILPRVETVTSLLSQVEERYDLLSDELSSESEAVANQLSSLIIALIAVAVAVCVIVAIILTRWIVRKMHWYEDVLDNIPFPLSVTDEKRLWTFINRPVENMLGMKRDQAIGKPCSNWGATICGTNNCGVDCLERGKNTTSFEQAGADFKVDIAYLTDPKGRRVGHIEVVQDISEMVRTQKAGAALVENIEQVSKSFVTGSTQIADGAQALAQGSTQQAASIQELSGSISELSVGTNDNAAKAGQAAVLADSIKDNAEKGSRQMDEMMAAVKDINEASHSISRVIKTIDDIAFQTNILALNAAVEAARAGQHGKGFAVVAEEVRNLAAKSAEAAKDTEGLIEDSMGKAELGVRIAGETAASFSEIVTGINESGRLIGDITRLSEEQAAGISQINIGIDQVAQVVQQNSATAQQSAAAAQQMNSQAGMLKELLARYNEQNAVNSGMLEEPKARRELPPGK